MNHVDFKLSYRARCCDCGWDSGEVPTGTELLELIGSHHDLEVHTDALFDNPHPPEPT